MNVKKMKRNIRELTGLDCELTVTTLLPSNIYASVLNRHIVINGNSKVSNYLIIKAVAHEVTHLLGYEEHDAEFHSKWVELTQELWDKYNR